MTATNPERLAEESLALHARAGGKLEVRAKVPLRTKADLSRAYTPGVAAVCREIQRDPAAAFRYTMKGNSVAIVTDGSAVLGLGNIGGTAAIPVMEGKAVLFKKFAGIDAFPICFENFTPGFVEAVRSIAPVFGGINLEDIAAPRCFEVEESLQDIGIPVMHDDQHGTAIVVLAALLNACRVTGRRFTDLNVAIVGAGAAGYAIARLLRCIGYDASVCETVHEIVVCDRKGIIYRQREGLYRNKYKFILADETNHLGRSGGLPDALEGMDAVIGVSAGGVLSGGMIGKMKPNPIVFAMANPVPEIMPDEAFAAGAAVVGTGRSDLPNQINNALAFPGVFRGALDARARTISDEMKVAAAHAIAAYLKKPNKRRLLPGVLDRGLVKKVSGAVAEAARESGVNGSG